MRLGSTQGGGNQKPEMRPAQPPEQDARRGGGEDPALAPDLPHGADPYRLVPAALPRIRTSDATVHRACKRHGLNRFPNRVGRRAVHTHRDEKQVPGHHVKVDVKLLTLKRKNS
jgi:hypothetical protein